MRLDELARIIGADLHGDGAIEIAAVAPLADARAGQISFLANARYEPLLATTAASAVILAPAQAVPRDNLPLLRTKDPYYAFMQAVVALHGQRKHPHAGIHPKAHVEPTATVGQGTIIYPGAYIGPSVRIGRDCIIYPNVTIYDGCVLGDRVMIHAGTVIGADGFGYATSRGIHHKIPQIGNVVIEDDVEIGANTCIDRAALGQTVIGKGTKIDNLVQVGHNTRIGPHSILCGQVAIAGSCTLGHHVVLGGQVGVAGHLTIGDGAIAAAQSGISGDVPAQTTIWGTPEMPIAQARRALLLIRQLPEIVKRLRAVEHAVEELGDTGPGESIAR